MFELTTPSGSGVCFDQDEKLFWPRRLFGVDCADMRAATWPGALRGPALVCTTDKRYDGYDFTLVSCAQNNGEITVHWQAGELGLVSRWRMDTASATLCRQDTLTNTGRTPVTLTRLLSRIALQRGEYEVYAQSGRWANESQGYWLPLHTSRITLFNEQGRTTQNSTPYACLRETGVPRGLAFHILPLGNWQVRITSLPVMNGAAYPVLELGLADEDLHLTLGPGEEIACPEICIQPMRDGRPESAAPAVHRLFLEREQRPRFPEPPIVYNTWLDEFDLLHIDRLRRQLAAARSVGCDVFVIDAGWYGRSKERSSWFNEAGDWREKEESAFFGRMTEFADEVRSAGLGFGLWMEPEHMSEAAPIHRQHPEWFKNTGGLRWALENPDAYAGLKDEMIRLIETYRLAWMKVDFNVGLGTDAGELRPYYTAWYRLMDELRQAYPQVFFEGCSSGGMRSDLEVLRHFDMHFISDTTNPVDMLRIGEGSALRLPPGRIGRWLVLRSVGKTIPDIFASYPESLVAPACSGWQPSQVYESVDLDFAALAAMPGVFGISGDLAGISKPTRQRLKKHIKFYKTWRGFIYNSVGHLLTGVHPLVDRSGWSALQLTSPGRSETLVFAYRLQDPRPRLTIPLHNLDPQVEYLISTYPDHPEQLVYRAMGAALMQSGLEAQLPSPGKVGIYLLTPLNIKIRKRK